MYEQLTIFDVGKVCTSCNRQLPFSEFHKNRARKDGLNNLCKACNSAATKQSRSKDPERTRVRDRAARQRYRETVACEEQLERQRLQRAEAREKREAEWRSWFERGLQICRVCKIEQPFECFYAASKRKAGIRPDCIDCQREYRLENQERIKERKREYRKENPVRVREKDQRYRQENHAVLIQKQRLHYARNKDEIKRRRRKQSGNKNALYVQRRKARKLKQQGTPYDWDDLQIILCEQVGRCAYCEKQMRDYQIEHLLPLSRGGLDGLENIALACAFCNYSKGNKTVDEFMAYRRRVDLGYC